MEERLRAELSAQRTVTAQLKEEVSHMQTAPSHPGCAQLRQVTAAASGRQCVSTSHTLRNIVQRVFVGSKLALGHDREAHSEACTLFRALRYVVVSSRWSLSPWVSMRRCCRCSSRPATTSAAWEARLAAVQDTLAARDRAATALERELALRPTHEQARCGLGVTWTLTVALHGCHEQCAHI